METPRYNDIDDLTLTNEPERRLDLADSLKMFCNSVEIILHTINDNEREAVLELLEPPELEIPSGQRFPKKPIILSAIERIVLGMFGGYRCGLIQTDQGKNCRKGVENAFEKFPQAKFILAIGVGYALNPDKVMLGDVLFSKSINAFGNVKYDSAGRLYPRDDSLSRYKIPHNLLAAFINQKMLWPAKKAFPCARTEGGYLRPSRVHCGSILSYEALVDDEKVRNDLREKFNEAIGGEMEGVSLLEIEESLKSKHREIGVAIIKGVADFGDGKKNKIWQLTASKAAASFTRFCLEETQGELIPSDPSLDKTYSSTGVVGTVPESTNSSAIPTDLSSIVGSSSSNEAYYSSTGVVGTIPESTNPSGHKGRIWKKIPDELDAFNLVSKIAADWDMLGKYLGVPANERKGYDRGLYDQNSKLEHVVNYWRQSRCSPPTFENLHKVVDLKLHNKEIADDIEDFVTKKENEDKYINRRDYNIR